MALLDIRDLSVEFRSHLGTVRAADAVTLQVEAGEVVGIVGESGSGKSISMLAVMGLVPYPGRVVADQLAFADRDLLSLPERDLRRMRGKDIAMIFQDPMTSLNPCFTVGFQLMEALRLHEGMERRAARACAIRLLEQVGIPEAEARLGAFPHQFSGGMCQRVMIAMAIACNPRLLIADEPTTALDVTIQAQILELLRSLQRERQMALVLITHNMGVVAEMTDRVIVMYAGQIVEERDTQALFQAPQHPYSGALLEALPELSKGDRRLTTIPGIVPGLFDRPRGCLFHPRCQYATLRCIEERPVLRGWQGGRVRCHYPLSDPGRGRRMANDVACKELV